MTYETILYDEDESGVARITLNRPDVLNAFDRQMANEFVDVWTRIRLSDTVKAVVLRASGDRAFCTGADVKKGGFSDPNLGPFDVEDPGPYLGPKQHRVWKPLICAVHGLCAGGAFYFINEADIVICSEDAQFFDPHVDFGMVAAVEPIGAMARLSVSEVTRMALMGRDERIGAESALRISLVTEITTREQLWSRADELARSIASKPAIAIQGTVKAIWEAYDLPRSAAVSNAHKYCQLGNPIGKAQVDRWSLAKPDIRTR